MAHDNLKGAMFPDNNADVAYKGTLNINGETKYVSLIKAQTQRGEEVYEVAVSMGRVYLNPTEKKQNAKSPDVGGPITIDGKRYKFGAWNNVSEKGDSYLGLSLIEQVDNIPF